MKCTKPLPPDYVDLQEILSKRYREIGLTAEQAQIVSYDTVYWLATDYDVAATDELRDAYFAAL